MRCIRDMVVCAKNKKFERECTQCGRTICCCYACLKPKHAWQHGRPTFARSCLGACKPVVSTRNVYLYLERFTVWLSVDGPMYNEYDYNLLKVSENASDPIENEPRVVKTTGTIRILKNLGVCFLENVAEFTNYRDVERACNKSVVVHRDGLFSVVLQ